MSGKYNRSKRDRNRSAYPDRLAARGLSKTPTMPGLDTLLTSAARREREGERVVPNYRTRSNRQWASFHEYVREQGWDWPRHYGG